MDRVGLRDWLYRLGSELHDGPDSHLEAKVKAFADEVGKPDEAPENIVWDAPKDNPQPLIGLPHELTQVTQPTPVDPNALTTADIQRLKELLGKL